MVDFPKGIKPEDTNQYVLKVSKNGNEIKTQDNRGLHKVTNWLGRYIFSGNWSYKISNIQSYIKKQEIDPLSDAKNQDLQLFNDWVSSRLNSQGQWTKACAKLGQYFQTRKVRKISENSTNLVNRTSKQSQILNSNPTELTNSESVSTQPNIQTESRQIPIRFSNGFVKMVNINSSTTIGKVKQQIFEDWKKEAGMDSLTLDQCIFRFSGDRVTDDMTVVDLTNANKSVEISVSLKDVKEAVKAEGIKGLITSSVIDLPSPSSSAPEADLKKPIEELIETSPGEVITAGINAAKAESIQLFVRTLTKSEFLTIDVDGEDTIQELKKKTIDQWNASYEPKLTLKNVRFTGLGKAKDTDLAVKTLAADSTIGMTLVQIP